MSLSGLKSSECCTYSCQWAQLCVLDMQPGQNYKTQNLTAYQLTFGSFLKAITFMWSNPLITGWPQFFPLGPPWPISLNWAIIFRSFHLDFLCANLAMPIISHSFFRIFAEPVIWSVRFRPGQLRTCPSSMPWIVAWEHFVTQRKRSTLRARCAMHSKVLVLSTS